MGRSAGFALAAAALLRVFPGALFFGPAVRGVHQLWQRRRLDTELRGLALGAVAGLAVLLAASVLGTDAGSYRDFAQNSQKHAQTPLSNYMGLRTMFSWDPQLRDRMMAGRETAEQSTVWQQQKDITFRERQVWYVLSVAVLLGLTVLVSLRATELWLIALAGVVPIFCFFELTNYFYAIMALFAVWAYRTPAHAAVLLGLALGGTVVFLELQWRPIAYIANSALVLALLVYFLSGTLLARRAEFVQTEPRLAGSA
jgi:hypothetical protein